MEERSVLQVGGSLEKAVKGEYSIDVKADEVGLIELAKTLGKNKHETLAFLGELNIPFADYDLAEDLQTLDDLFPAS